MTRGALRAGRGAVGAALDFEARHQRDAEAALRRVAVDPFAQTLHRAPPTRTACAGDRARRVRPRAIACWSRHCSRDKLMDLQLARRDGVTASPPLAHDQLDAADRGRLVALHGELHAQLPAIAARFCDGVCASPVRASGSAVDASAESSCAALVDWMSVGLLGPYDDAFRAKRSVVVHRHTQIGMTQQHMFTAMNAVRAAYLARIAEVYAPDRATLVRSAVDKLFELELALMLGQYELDATARLVTRERKIHFDRIDALQTMTAGLAHEVRNPLNAAKLQLELLERRLRRHGDDPKLTEPIGRAHHEIRRLTDMLDEFLSFARPPELLRAEHDVIAIARQVLELERPLADRNGVRLELSSPTPTVVAAIDPGKLHEILRHLVRNGLEATARGGAVTVAIALDADALHLRVGDSGPGIAELVRPRIYEPFFSTKETGTGMGMSIVYNFVTMHAGTIDLVTGPQGTSFDVTLPQRRS